MHSRFVLPASLILAMLFGQPIFAGEPKLVFEFDVQPLLNQKCGKCHRQDLRKGGLDLSSMAGLRRGGESGESVVGVSLDDSLLWELIEAGEMPPDDEPELTETQQETIRRWIVGGAYTNSSDQFDKPELTQHDVLPIMLLRCSACHGAQHQQGGLDLRSVAGMLSGGKSGTALVKGDPDASLMIQRVESHACPPSGQLLKFFVRRPPKSEVAILRRWIANGATEFDISPDVATVQPDPLVSDQDREHWAFQPPRKTTNYSTIDQFIGARLTSAGLDFAPRADRETLIRRVYFDLIGMPPDLAELRRWRESNNPDWFSAMVDDLLASPSYGERWGRYWLDLAGYADSEGGVSSDPLRPVAWKYRDYVIDSFNSDKPYDQFLIEQLAGDELVDYENASEVTDQMVENLVATGFLRMGVDETGSRTMNFVPERLKVIADAIHVVSSGLMGLTMECARCHSHKYDPIPHRDYFRFKAIFQGALDEHDWYSFKTRKLQLATTDQKRLIAQVNPPLQLQVKRLESARKKLIRQIRLGLLQHHYPDQSPQDNRATLKALTVADNVRTLAQRTLVERLQVAELKPEDQQPDEIMQQRARVDELNHQIDRLRRRMVPESDVRALVDQGRPSPTYILRRGEHDNPGDLVGPGVPSVLTDGQTRFPVAPPFPDGTAKTGRRLAFARWLTRPDHPLTSRVMVNRIWYHHFGRGLVKELNNFGNQSESPTHPDLLDWLAVEFVQHGWSIKSMHRMMLNSRTYQQSSLVGAQQRQVDPENLLWSRMPLRRLDAEALRDSLLSIGGKLNNAGGGIPDTVTVDREGAVSANPTAGGGWRRSIYLQYRRTEIPTFMDTFDYPPMGPNCVSRNVSTIATQPLILTNDARVYSLARAMAEQVIAQLPSKTDTPSAQVETVYQMALSRFPDEQERTIGVEALRELTEGWNGDRHRALVTYCHTIINSAAFLYVD